MPAVAGFNSRILLGSTILRGYHWRIDWRVDPLDVTTFESFGHGQWIRGVEDCEVSFDAYYDSLDNPFAAPLVIAPGTTYTAFSIQQTKVAGTETWTLAPGATLTLFTVNSEAGVRDTVRFTVTGKISGNGLGAGIAPAVE